MNFKISLQDLRNNPFIFIIASLMMLPGFFISKNEPIFIKIISVIVIVLFCYESFLLFRKQGLSSLKNKKLAPFYLILGLLIALYSIFFYMFGISVCYLVPSIIASILSFGIGTYQLIKGN